MAVGRVAAAALLIAAVQAQTPATTMQVTAVSTAKAGYTTYQVAVSFDNTVLDVYALFGEAGNPLIIPGGFQLAAPFGSDVGPVRATKQTAPCCLLASRLPRKAHRPHIQTETDGPVLHRADQRGVLPDDA